MRHCTGTASDELFALDAVVDDALTVSDGATVMSDVAMSNAVRSNFGFFIDLQWLAIRDTATTCWRH